jgi:tRNA (Thr-GGU) A37 N-methylase
LNCFIGCTFPAAISSCKARRTVGTSRGTFSLRPPARPNPIGTAIAHLVGIEGAIVTVRGLDCLDGTPLLDLKPDRGLFTPIAPPQPGDFQVGDP